MNNTKSLAIVAVLTAATLVIGVTFAATPSAFAQGSGNTNTTQANKQKGIQSGWDNDFEQSASNVICTHPFAICQEGD